MNELVSLLAQTAAPTTQPGAGGLGSLLNNPFIPLILMLAVFWWIMSSGRRREQKRFQDMLSNLKKNDRVLTIGGIVGTVVEVRDDVVVLKVDENNNTKMHFMRSAVKDVLREPAAAAAK